MREIFPHLEIYMENYKEAAEAIRKIVGDDRVLIDEPLKNHTNFHCGGPADLLIIPKDAEDLKELLQYTRSKNIPVFIIGNGTNLLVRDKGIRGAVIKVTDLDSIKVDGDMITAEAGAELKEISKTALRHDLTGMEFSCGIPGSFGGAVYMNAGAYKGEMSETLEEVTVLKEDGTMLVLKKDELELGYRTSAVKKKGYIVISGKMRLRHGDHEEIAAKIGRLTQMREEKQPLEAYSAGSTFKRPEGHFAGQLIEECGFRGFEMNGAAVSDKHCGFVINKNGATSEAVIELIRHIQKTVLENKGVELETEVLIVGEE